VRRGEAELAGDSFGIVEYAFGSADSIGGVLRLGIAGVDLDPTSKEEAGRGLEAADLRIEHTEGDVGSGWRRGTRIVFTVTRPGMGLLGMGGSTE
jgi:hypothetical protein